MLHELLGQDKDAQLPLRLLFLLRQRALLCFSSQDQPGMFKQATDILFY